MTEIPGRKWNLIIRDNETGTERVFGSELEFYTLDDDSLVCFGGKERFVLIDEFVSEVNHHLDENSAGFRISIDDVGTTFLRPVKDGYIATPWKPIGRSVEVWATGFEFVPYTLKNKLFEGAT